ncbi:MAG: hypothetical protein WC153_06695 [Candidatus Methanomethylophilaceae archaeon]
MKIETDDDRLVLISAFRYALGRCSYMPSVVAGVLAQCWDDLTEHDQRMIKREIAEAIEQGHAGMDCDVATWRRVLALGDKKHEDGVESKNAAGV